MRRLLAVTIPARFAFIAGCGSEGELPKAKSYLENYMFETHEQARVRQPFIVLEEGARRWAYISQTTNDEWFFVTYETLGEEGSSQQQFMISKVEYLLDLASRDSIGQFIHEVQLVSPPWLNEKRKWLMEPLSAIYTVDERVCYQVVDGQIYPSKFLGQPRDLLWSMEPRADE